MQYRHQLRSAEGLLGHAGQACPSQAHADLLQTLRATSLLCQARLAAGTVVGSCVVMGARKAPSASTQPPNYELPACLA